MKTEIHGLIIIMILTGFPTMMLAEDYQAKMEKIFAGKEDDFLRMRILMKNSRVDELKKFVFKNSYMNHTAWNQLIELSHTNHKARQFLKCTQWMFSQEHLHTWVSAIKKMPHNC